MTGPFQPGWYPDRSGVPSVAASALHPKDDPFYSDDKPLEGVALGTVLMTRRLPVGSTRWPSRSPRVQSSRDMDLEMGSVSLLQIVEDRHAPAALHLSSSNGPFGPHASARGFIDSMKAQTRIYKG